MNYNPNEATLIESLEEYSREAEFYLEGIARFIKQKNDQLDAEFKRNGTYTQLPASPEFLGRISDLIGGIKESRAPSITP